VRATASRAAAAGARRRAALVPAAFAALTARYWLSVYPRFRREARDWRERAGQIPDPALRGLALETLREERGNLEGAAAFAVLAPHAERARVVRALVAFQAIYDYADTLAEQSSSDPAANGRQLHLALLDALGRDGGGSTDHADSDSDSGPGHMESSHADRADQADSDQADSGHVDSNRAGTAGYYAYSARQDDGGYLGELIAACAAALGTLPGYAAVAARAQAAAARMVDFQSLAHDDRADSKERLADWAERRTPHGSGLEWWETAAGAASSLLVFALIAHAAGSNTGEARAEAIERAYFPWIGALHVLLDSLVDQADDARAGRHSLVEHYGSPSELTGRLRAIAAGAVQASGTLPDGARHELILAAMASFYLSQPAASSPAGAPAKAAILATLGERATLAMWLFRVRAGRYVRAGRRGRRRGSL
jgi:tetraprenyl-beta-curcumene synthase